MGLIWVNRRGQTPPGPLHFTHCLPLPSKAFGCCLFLGCLNSVVTLVTSLSTFLPKTNTFPFSARSTTLHQNHVKKECAAETFMHARAQTYKTHSLGHVILTTAPHLPPTTPDARTSTLTLTHTLERSLFSWKHQQIDWKRRWRRFVCVSVCLRTRACMCKRERKGWREERDEEVAVYWGVAAECGRKNCCTSASTHVFLFSEQPTAALVHSA